jgi:hypothetical protein
VKVAVDDKHNLILASEVVNDSSDVHQLHSMAKAAKDALGVDVLQALADEGYYSSAAPKACEDDGIEAYVPPSVNVRLEKKGRLSLKDFHYDATADAYTCPAGEWLLPMNGRKRPSGDTLCEHREDLRDLRAEGSLPLGESSQADHQPLGARGRSRTSSRAPLLQLYPRAQHPWLRTLRDGRLRGDLIAQIRPFSATSHLAFGSRSRSNLFNGAQSTRTNHSRPADGSSCPASRCRDGNTSPSSGRPTSGTQVNALLPCRGVTIIIRAAI